MKILPQKFNMMKSIKTFIKQEYYLIPWYWFFSTVAILSFTFYENLFVRLVLAEAQGTVREVYKWGMAFAGTAAISGYLLYSQPKWFVRIDTCTRGRVDNLIMKLIWFLLYIMFLAPFTISLVCYMNIDEIFRISSWMMAMELLSAAVLDAVLLVLCRHYYYNKEKD